METSLETRTEARSSWLDRPVLSTLTLSWETVLFASILILAVITRFYMLEPRVMSHDETSHVYFSWLLSQGRGYMHDPVTHGPFQFHIVALSYFLFGDNDFTARIPVALFSIAAVAFVWAFRSYLGKAGTLVTALLMVISPYLLYYGRYVRNEAFVVLFGLVTLWAILRYLERGEARYLYFLSAATVLHFATKETAYIYTAQVLLFLGFYLIYRVTQQPWRLPRARTNFLLFLIGFLLLLSGAAALLMLNARTAADAQAAPAIPGQETFLSTIGGNLFAILLGVLALVSLALAAYSLLTGFGLARLRRERTFDLLILVGGLVLPLLSAFVISALGINVPDNAGDVNAMTLPDILRMGLIVLAMFLIANLAGAWWNWRLWLGNFALFYTIFTVFYTTLFTNGAGLATGLVGGLGYWLEQHEVNRGSQPWYYYALVQVPVYEYLPAIGSLLALGLALFKGKKRAEPDSEPAVISSEEPEGLPASQTADIPAETEIDTTEIAAQALPYDPYPPELAIDASAPEVESLPETAPFLALFGFWALTSLLAYSVAGEKMPWLTVHITFPMIFLAGWSIGRLIDTTHWKKLLALRGVLALALLPVFLTSAAAALGSLLGTNPPFQGQDLQQLQDTSAFITAFLAAVASGWGLVVLMKTWPAGQITRLFGLAALALLTLLTARTAFTASFINYDLARELLVYAHSGPGAKEAMDQIDEISRRTTNGLALQVGYDDETSYPFWWYLRNFSNQRFFGKNPTRDLRQSPVILVGDANYEKMKPVVGDNYASFEYIRMWWPDQGYFNLTTNRILYALTNAEWREALFQIWLNRDYTLYSKLINKDLSLPNWDPSNRFRLYVRKDIVGQIWNYGTSPSEVATIADPYEKGQTTLVADIVLGSPGNEPGQFAEPRGIAVAPDGSLYVADTMNHRIQHLAPDGTLLKVWGSYADIAQGSAPDGTFNQPWDVAIGPDGSVYVADTWNHRIQKFTPEGEFITKWGFGISQSDDPFGYYGPRGIAVGQDGGQGGYVYITDTGNKRVLVYTENGEFVTQFGGAGLEPGQFNEPVGIALDQAGNLYVADVWNQRMQAFAPSGDGQFTPLYAWDIEGWYGQSLNNYPYVAVDGQGHVFATDPEGYRVLEFAADGQFVRYWGDFGVGNDRFTLPSGIASDGSGGVWVVDSGSSRLMHFNLPAE